MAVDRTRLCIMLRSPEGQILREWLALQMAQTGEYLQNPALDYSDVKTQTLAHRRQGESMLIRRITSDDPTTSATGFSDSWIDELANLADKKVLG
jgi:hypothetical protein